jgi:hypothetical protein
VGVNAYVFGALEDAEIFGMLIDDALGYPRTGAPQNGGLHADAEEAITEHYGYVIAHPGGAQWAYPSDAAIDDVAPEGSPIPSTLDASWFPPDEL